MVNRILKIAAVVLAAGVLMAVLGCGEKSQESPLAVDTVAINEFNQKLEELKSAEMTAEIVLNGQPEGKWSQNGMGSWRWESSQDVSSYVIYNAVQNKTWAVTGNSATELAEAQKRVHELNSPALLLGSFQALTHLPRTGSTSDTWEWEFSGISYLTMEFKGPDGLISKVTDEDVESGETDVTEFRYSEIGEVPDSRFELPAGVTVQPAAT